MMQDVSAGEPSVVIDEDLGQYEVDDGVSIAESPLAGYFALASPDDIGHELMDLKDEFYHRLQSSGMLVKMQKSWRASYGLSPAVSPGRSDQIVHGGEQGELTYINVNHWRNLEQHLLSLTTAQRPEPEPIATNTDLKSYEQTVLAKGLLDYYNRQLRIERRLRTAAEHAIKVSDGYVMVEWDPAAGDDYAPTASGTIAKQGDISLSNPTALDVIKDLDLSDADSDQWVMIRCQTSKYDLAGRYMPFAEDIVGTPESADVTVKQWRLNPGLASSDQVFFYKFFHKRTAAVPEGRHVVVAEGGLVLHDGPMPYKKLPVNRIAPGDIVGTPFGYTPMFDLLAIQEAINALYTAVVSNQTAFGVQSIWVPESSNLSYEQLATGLNLIKTSGTQKPEALNLVSTPAEIFKFIEQLEHAMETISGINAVQRGDVPPGIESGNALAMMSAQAIQFSSGLQASYAALVEDVYTDILNLLKDFATTPRTALIVGSYNQHMLKQFTGESLSSVSRVMVDVGSPMSRTAQGREQLAQNLLAIPNSGLTPQQYMSVYKTGNLDEMTQSVTRQLMLIKQENELLASGRPCKVMVTDDHVLHIRENATVLANPELREDTPENNAIIDAATQHLMQHVEMGSDPALMPLLSSLGYQPIVAPQPVETQAGGTPAGGGPNMAPPPQGDGGGGPDFPQNPLTGQEWDPNSGGGGPPVAETAPAPTA